MNLKPSRYLSGTFIDVKGLVILDERRVIRHLMNDGRPMWMVSHYFKPHGATMLLITESLDHYAYLGRWSSDGINGFYGTRADVRFRRLKKYRTRQLEIMIRDYVNKAG